MSRNASTIRRLREEAMARGECQQCRCRPAKPGCVTCVECLQRLADRKRSNKARGLCECGNARVAGLKACSVCRDDRVARAGLRKAIRRSQGLCSQCWEEAAPDRTMCPMHLEIAARQRRDLYARRRAA